MPAHPFAVVFDLDGVLIDSETHWKQVDASFLKGLVHGWTEEKQRSIFGMSIFSIFDLLTRDHGLTMSKKEFLTYYYDLAKDIYRNRITMIDGARELIIELSEKDVPLAIASSSAEEWIRLAMERFNLSDRFVGWAGADTVGGEGKPAPKVYLRAAELLGFSPERCVAIEDSNNGIASAKGAGMFCIGYRTGRNDDQTFEGVDREVDTLSAINSKKLADWFFSS